MGYKDTSHVMSFGIRKVAIDPNAQPAGKGQPAPKKMK